MIQEMFSPITLFCRPRRNRKSAAIRALVQETRLHPAQLIAPFFVIEGLHQREAIATLPDTFRLSVDEVIKESEALLALGIRAINLFCYTPAIQKDSNGSQAVQKDNLLQRSIRQIKRALPELLVMSDIALDPYTSHGHDGVVGEDGNILNDPTLEILAQMALRAAEAGCDVVSPSDMMDGRIGYLRKALDQHGFQQVGILSYAVKQASSFYGPFRQALDSTPQFGDKKSYQMNPANVHEALLECQLDEQEGADMLLIKPALTNLDIIAKVRSATHLPLGAFQVSGEWAMLKAAAEQGWIKEENALMEALLAMRRAGADFIFTYGAKKAAQLLVQGFLHN
jgi:porphobilinogen synthase